MTGPPLPRKVLVTGATGILGRHVVAQLAGRAQVVCRALSRSGPPAEPDRSIQWRRGDLLTDPLEPLLDDIDALIHLASAKGSGDDDVAASARLLDAARTAGVAHAVVVSIIGCDRIALPFYDSKRRIEALVQGAGVPWTIVRVAQFHSFVARLVSAPAALPVPVPIFADLRFQSVDEAEAAAHLVEVALGPPLARAPDLAGPEVLTLGHAAALWFAATGKAPMLVPVPLAAIAGQTLAEPRSAPWAIAVLAGYQAGWNTPQGERRLGRVTFAEWLAAHHGERSPVPGR